MGGLVPSPLVSLDPVSARLLRLPLKWSCNSFASLTGPSITAAALFGLTEPLLNLPARFPHNRDVRIAYVFNPTWEGHTP
jgi:hypothetical protein